MREHIECARFLEGPRPSSRGGQPFKLSGEGSREGVQLNQGVESGPCPRTVHGRLKEPKLDPARGLKLLHYIRGSRHFSKKRRYFSYYYDAIFPNFDVK